MRCVWLSDNDGVGQLRVDKWLWAARFFRSRGVATEAVNGGRVHVNGGRVKPSKEIRVGDTLEVTIGEVQRTIVVTGIAERRGSATFAATLYEETAESAAKRERLALERRLARPPGAQVAGRPTKQDRRRLDALRGSPKRRRGTGR